MSLPTTTLSQAVGSSDLTVVLPDTSAVTAIGMWLYLDSEAMRVTALPRSDGSVTVARGVGGSRALPHLSEVTVYVGQSYQFYTQNPEGEPPTVPFVLPWINVISGGIWTVLGNAWVLSGGAAPVGNVVGPASATDGAVALFDGTTGLLLKDGVTLGADIVTGPASVTAGKVAVFSGMTGKVVAANATGVTVGPFTVITGIQVVNGLVTALTGS